MQAARPGGVQRPGICKQVRQQSTRAWYAEATMYVRHGSPLVVLGAVLAIGLGTGAYIMTQSLEITLGVAAGILAAFAFSFNRTPPSAISEGGLLSRPSALARSALFYVTFGLLTDVWCGVWYVYLYNHPPARDVLWYACYGFLLMGLAFFIIGLTLGHIARSARIAELPPAEVTPEVTQAAQQAAARGVSPA